MGLKFSSGYGPYTAVGLSANCSWLELFSGIAKKIHHGSNGDHRVMYNVCG